MGKSTNNGHAAAQGGMAGSIPQSTRWWDDETFQDQLVNLLIYNREALEQCGSILVPEDFRPLRGMKNGRARAIVSERALEYYEKKGQPLDTLVRADVLAYCERLNLASGQIADITQYLDYLDKLKPVSTAYLVEQAQRFKAQRSKASAILELIDLQSSDQLTDDKWREISEKALAASKEPEPAPVGAQWPEPLEPEALQGLAGDIVTAITPHTEADPAALLLQTLASFGNVVGRDPHWMHGATRHGLNLFVGIVGATGTGKGSGLDMIMDMFSSVDSAWSGNPNIYAGLASGEGFIHMVRDATHKRKKDGELVIDDPGVEDKRLLIVQPEFAQVLEVMERQGNTLATKLRNAWDGKPLANNSLSSHLVATGAHISLIVHTTEDDLRDLMRRTMILNGFGNRFLWVCSKRSKSKPFGGVVPAKDKTTLVERLRSAVDFARELKKLGRWRGRMFFEKPAASNLWVSAYNTTLTRESENPVTGRAMPQVRRMACVYALMDCSEQVAEKHLQAALATWRYCAEGARFIFGGVHKVDPISEKVFDALRATKAPGIAGRNGMTLGLTRKEIHTQVFSGNKSAEEITRIMESLKTRGKVRVQIQPASAKGGRPAERWFAVG